MKMTLRPFNITRTAHSGGARADRLPVEEKHAFIMDWLNSQRKDIRKTMLYLVMYDIENDRIRTHIAKYLLRNGCIRIQKSIYLAKTSKSVYRNIHRVLHEINEMYDNHDSIFLLPVPEEKFKNIKIIGRNVEYEVVTEEKNVLFI